MLLLTNLLTYFYNNKMFYLVTMKKSLFLSQNLTTVYRTITWKYQMTTIPYWCQNSFTSSRLVLIDWRMTKGEFYSQGTSSVSVIEIGCACSRGGGIVVLLGCGNLHKIIWVHLVHLLKQSLKKLLLLWKIGVDSILGLDN